jgi:protoporphyrinogen oxidase
MSRRITILGAGPTGLGAAHRLAELDHDDWDIYERADHVGGLAASYLDPQGFLWDHGGHVMFSHYQYFDELVEKMLRGDYDQHLREAWVWMCDRYVPYPFQNNIHRLPPAVFLECLMGIIDAQRGDRPRDDFDEWISAIFGDGIARHFMAPYNFKVWAHPLTMMSTSWQGDRVPDVDVRRILENLLEDRDDVSWGPNNKFKFPLLGTGMLYERIAESLPKAVNLEKEAVEVDTATKQVTFSDGSTTDYDALVSTMPLTELLRLIPGRPPELDAAALDLHHTEGLFVGIGVADPCPSTKCWMYFPESDSPFYRVTYLSNYSPRMTPPGEHFSLLAEVSSSPYKVEDPETVVDRTIAGLVSSKLLTPEQAAGKIVSRQLLRVPYSYPVPTGGRDRALATI